MAHTLLLCFFDIRPLTFEGHILVEPSDIHQTFVEF
jgi:hypothetical protein